MWRCHVFYESQPHSIIVTLGDQPYRIPKVVPTTVPKQVCRKFISHTAKFILFKIWSQLKEITTTVASSQDPSIQHKNINKIVEENQDIPTTPTRVPPHDKSLHVLHDASPPTESSQTQEDHARILFKQIQPLQQQVHNNLQQAKQGSFFNKESNSPRFRFSKIFPGDLTQWIPLLPKGGRIDPGGNKWPPTYSIGSKHGFPPWYFFYGFLGPELPRQF
jgi:hypothetical protein